MRSTALLITITFVLGCTSQPDTESQSVQEESGSTLSEPIPNEHVEHSPEPTKRPKSAEQLTTMFNETYQSDPKTAFVNFFDWHGVSQQSRRQILNGLLNLAYSPSPKDTYQLKNPALSIIDIERHSAELGLSVKEFKEAMPVSISHVFNFEIEKPNGIVIHTTLGIGQRDGNFYFYPDYYPDK